VYEIKTLLEQLDERHRTALNWFATHAESDQSWPDTLPDGAMLATRAKGIYKPEWSIYAVSVRQSLGGPYADRDPIYRPDGTWVFAYFQEGADPNSRDDHYTNRGLIACLRDQIPVGVLRQVIVKPLVRYHVLGLALVAG
jgi:hypothetical protein